ALMSTVISDLVEGEFMQLKSDAQSNWESYVRKTYLKTASLVANGCKSAAILGGLPRAIIDLSYEYGKHFGLAFQVTFVICRGNTDSILIRAVHRRPP